MSDPRAKVLNRYIYFAIWMKNSFNVSESDCENLLQHFDHNEVASSKEIMSLIDIVSAKYEERLEEVLKEKQVPNRLGDSLNQNAFDQIRTLTKEIDHKDDELDLKRKEIQTLQERIAELEKAKP